MHKLFLIVLFSISSLLATAQIKVTWQELADVKFEDRYSEEVDAYFQFPLFGQAPIELDSKYIYITGYVIPVNVETGFYVLSSNPYSSCFFCGGSGPESVVELELKEGHRRFRVDERLTFKGTLNLNSKDIYKMTYILVDAEITN